MPDEELGGTSMNFDNSSTWKYQVDGRNNGAEAVRRGEGYNFKKLVEWFDSDELQKEFKFVDDYIEYSAEKDKVGRYSLEFI